MSTVGPAVEQPDLFNQAVAEFVTALARTTGP
jgi:hypothetical protein